MASDRAEVTRPQACDIEGAETPHGDPSDGHAIRVRVEETNGLGDDLLHHVPSPGSIRPVVVVAVIAPVGEHHVGSPRARRPDGRQESVGGLRDGRPAAPVQEDQERPSPSVRQRRRHDADFLYGAVQQRAAQVKWDLAQAVFRGVGTRVAAAPGDVAARPDHHHGEQGGTHDAAAPAARPQEPTTA